MYKFRLYDVLSTYFSFLDAEIGKCFYKRESGSVIPSLSSSSYVSSYVYRATGKILNEKTLPNRLVVLQHTFAGILFISILCVQILVI